jgi:dienelactone hydrolase
LSARLAAAALSLLLAVAAQAAPAPSPPPRIPAEAFGALPFLSEPAISPDGHHLVAGSAVDGKKGVILADLEKPDYAIGAIPLPDKVDVTRVRWAGNHRVLISLLMPTKLLGIELRVSRLLLYDIDAKQLKVVGGDKIGGIQGDNVIFIDPAGAYILLSSQRSLFDTPSVQRIDLATMKAEQAVGAKSGVWKWFADRTGAVRAGLGSDGTKWWLYYRDSPGADFQKIAKGASHQDTLDDVETLLPTAGSGSGYVIANKATGRYAVYRYDFRTATIGSAVYENPQVDVEAVAFSNRTGELDAIHYVDERERILWLDPAMEALQAKLDRALPGYVNRIVSRDETDNRMIVWSSSASDPGIYYVFDRSTSQLRRFAQPYAELDGQRLAPVEPVHYAARDGLDIPGYLTLPLGRDPKNLPLILMPHGGPFERDKGAYDAEVQFLANRGYVVLQPNFRGSTGYGKAYVDAATGEWGRKMQDDLDDGVHWLVQRGIVDPKRVCIMGASYGGYAALWGAVRNPELYRCAISLAGISDMPAMVRYDSTQLIATRYFRDWRDRVRGQQHQDLDAVSALPHAAEIRIPLLIAHGKMDGRVPPSQSIRLHEALEKAGRVHEYVLYPEEGHGFDKAADAVDFLKRVDAFLARYNPAG